MSDVVGVGIDLVDVDRFGATITRRPALVARLFTPREITDAGGRPERLAARFAAKEATLKVMGCGLGAAPFTSIEVERGESGVPSLLLHGRAAELARERSITQWQLSLTHTDRTAGAVALGLSSPMGGVAPSIEGMDDELAQVLGELDHGH
jgi:holo-[acyl-carrier protein] synthase